MENLKRYGFHVTSSPSCIFGELENGPYVLFSDVAEALKPPHNSAMVPCPFRNDTVGCPLSSELWVCGDKPCIIQRAQHQ